MNTDKISTKDGGNKFIYAIGFFCFMSIAKGEIETTTHQNEYNAQEIALPILISNCEPYYLTSKI